MALNRIASSVLSIILITATAIAWSMETSTETTDQSLHQNANAYFPSAERHISLLNQMDKAPLFQNLCKIGTGNEEKCAELLGIFDRVSYYNPPIRSNSSHRFAVYCKDSLPQADQPTCDQQVQVMVKLLDKYYSERLAQLNTSGYRKNGHMNTKNHQDIGTHYYIEGIAAEIFNGQSSDKSS